MAYARSETAQSFESGSVSTLDLNNDTSWNLDHAVGDVIVLAGSVDGSQTISESTGLYTQQVNEGGNGHREYLFFKRVTTLNEALPTFTLGSADSMTAHYLVLRGVSASNPVGNTARSAGSGNSRVFPTITHSANSVILALGTADRRNFLTPAPVYKLAGVEDTGGDGSQLASLFVDEAGTSPTGYYMGFSQSNTDNQTTQVIEFLDDGNITRPPCYVKGPIGKDLGMLNNQDASDNNFRNAIAASRVMIDGSGAMLEESFNAGTDITAASANITISGHDFLEADIVQLFANGATLSPELTDQNHYYVNVIDTNTIALRDGTGTNVYFNTNADIVHSATGSGAVTLVRHNIYSATIADGNNGEIARPPQNHGSGLKIQTGYFQLSLGAVDFTGYRYTTRFTSKGDNTAVYITFMDGSDNWRSYNILGGSILTDGFVSIDVADSSTEAASSGTLDITNIQRIACSVVRSGENARSDNVYWQRRHYGFKKLVPILGANVNGATLEAEVKSWGEDFMPSLLDLQTGYKFGNGPSDTNNCIADFSGEGLAFTKVADSIDNLPVHGPTFGIEKDLNSTSSVSLSAALISGKDEYFYRTASTNAGTVSDDAVLIVGGANVSYQSGNSVNNATIVNPASVDFDSVGATNSTLDTAPQYSGTDPLVNPTFKKTTSTTGAVLWSPSLALTNPTVRDNTFGLEIANNGDETIDLSDWNFPINTTDLNVTAVSGTKTIQLGAGQSVPSFAKTVGTSVVIEEFQNTINVTNLPTASGALVRLQIENTTAKSASTWQASTSYSANTKVLRTSGVGTENTAGLFFTATTAGTSGSTEPTWDTTPGNTTNDGSVVWTCHSVLFYDADPNATSLVLKYTEGCEFTQGDSYNVELAELEGSTAFRTYQTSGVAGSLGFDIQINYVTDPVYASNAIDGSSSSVTDKFTANYSTSNITLDANLDFRGIEAYAYYCFELTTSQGMYSFFGAVTALDAGNYRVNTGVASIFFDETSGFVKQTDTVRWFRSDGQRMALDPTTGGAGVAINDYNQAFGIETSGGGGSSDWTDAEKEQIRDAIGVDGAKTTAVGGQLQSKSEFDASVDTVTTDDASRTASRADVSGIPTNPLLANDSRLDNLDAAISTRSTFNSASDTVEANNMRGTDNALLASNYTAPANSDVGAIKTVTDQLLNILNTSGVVLTSEQVSTIRSGLATSLEITNSQSAIQTDINQTDGKVDQILADTDELQQNQDSGGSSDVNVVQVGGVSVSGPIDLKADVSAIQNVTDQLINILQTSGVVLTTQQLNSIRSNIATISNQVQIDKNIKTLATQWSPPSTDLPQQS